MKYKRFGKTNFDISALTIGTWAMGGDLWGDVNIRDTNEAVAAMIDHGVNSLDSAISYQDGGSERAAGQAIKGLRDKLFITTKCVLIIRDGDFARDGTYDTVKKCCDQSLLNMGIDFIDNYMIHWPDPKTPIAETMSALNDLKKEGKIGNISVSNFTKEQIEEAMQYGEIASLQMIYSMVDRSNEELLKWAHEKGLGVMTAGSLGAGILTGAYREMPKLAENDARILYYDFYKEPRFSKIQDLLKTMDQISENHGGVPLAQIAINWLRQEDFVDT